MTTDQNKQLVVDHFTRLTAGDLAGAGALLAEDCINHSAIPEAQGRAGFLSIMTKLRGAFPDMAFQVEDVIGEGDRTMVRATFTGTHRGPLAFARMPLPATDKPVRVEQIHIVRTAHGQIVEHWMSSDLLSMFRQLGVQVGPAT